MPITPSQAVAAIRCVCKRCRRAADDCENCSRARRAIRDASTADNKWLPVPKTAPPDWLKIRYATLLDTMQLSPQVFRSRHALHTPTKITMVKLLREPGPFQVVATLEEIAEVMGYSGHAAVSELLALDKR